MMTIGKLIILLLTLIYVTHAGAESEVPLIEVFKNPQCECCSKWVDHLRENGFTVKTHDVRDVAAERARLGMPAEFAACHTARIEGYLVEGHVPAADIHLLLREQPQALGLAVSGMPAGSPGMEGPPPVPYETRLIGTDGASRVFARH